MEARKPSGHDRYLFVGTGIARYPQGHARFHLLVTAFAVEVKFDATACMAISSDMAAEIARRYRGGASKVGIAAALHLSEGVVRRVLDRMAISARPTCPASGPHLNAILALHTEGKSIGQISALLGLNFATVYRVLVRAGRVTKKSQ